MKTNKNSMDLYFDLCKTPTFTFEDVKKFYDNEGSARSALSRLIKNKWVAKIRNNLYTCISAESGVPIATPFEIASAITPTSYISHHSALQFYGAYTQFYSEIQVSSATKFRDFYFGGYRYKFIRSISQEGVVVAENNPFIKVTDEEKTLVDVIKDMDRYVGIDETLKSIDDYSRVDERKILRYLLIYKNRHAYQKIGYLLYEDRKNLGLSSAFFKTCMKMAGKSKGYLTSDYKKGHYDKRWRLVIPNALKFLRNEGLENADI